MTDSGPSDASVSQIIPYLLSLSDERRAHDERGQQAQNTLRDTAQCLMSAAFLSLQLLSVHSNYVILLIIPLQMYTYDFVGEEHCYGSKGLIRIVPVKGL